MARQSPTPAEPIYRMVYDSKGYHATLRALPQ